MSCLGYKRFADEVAAAGLHARECSGVHWQILGGMVLVNFWPNTRRGHRIHAAGAASAQDVRTVAEAIGIAKTGPMKGTKIAKRKKNQNYPRRVKRSLLRKNPHCHYCGKFVTADTSHADHFIPLFRGGSNSQDNFRLACADCDNRKGHLMPGEFAPVLALILEERQLLAEV